MRKMYEVEVNVEISEAKLSFFSCLVPDFKLFLGIGCSARKWLIQVDLYMLLLIVPIAVSRPPSSHSMQLSDSYFSLPPHPKLEK